MIRLGSVLPNKRVFDLVALKERQNSLQYSTQIEISFCIALLVGAKRQRSSAYIMHAIKSDNQWQPKPELRNLLIKSFMYKTNSFGLSTPPCFVPEGTGK